MAALTYWLWLANRRGISKTESLALLDRFGTPEAVYFADPGEYELCPGLTERGRESLLDKSLDGAERILEQCNRLDHRVVTMGDANYCQRLKNIYDPPLVLYVKGKDLTLDNELAIAVVGARTPTPYGVKMAGRIGLDLARHGAVVVSGIAQGIDTMGLKAALNGGGTVVSVVGGGLDVIYPRENRFLYEDVATVGMLISEYPPGTEIRPQNFPIRNRIISGLSVGVTVVECRRQSGTMITASKATEQDRDLFAVPGNADAPMSEGPNWLIQSGAKLVTSGWDIVEEYTYRFPHKIRRPKPLEEGEEAARLAVVTRSREADAKRAVPEKKEVDKPKGKDYIDLKSLKPELTDDQADILRALSEKTMQTDELIEATQIPARRVLSALTMLQLRGFVTEGAGKRFDSTVLPR